MSTIYNAFDRDGNKIPAKFIPKETRKSAYDMGRCIAVNPDDTLVLVDAELFDTLMLVCAGWTGIAFSSKLSKLGEALKDAKDKK